MRRVTFYLFVCVRSSLSALLSLRLCLGCLSLTVKPLVVGATGLAPSSTMLFFSSPFISLSLIIPTFKQKKKKKNFIYPIFSWASLSVGFT